MVQIEVSYGKSEDEKRVYDAIQKIGKKFRTVKICKEYRNRKGYHVVCVRMK